MRTSTKIILAVLIVFAAGLWYFGWALVSHGFSAREKPSRLEAMLARRARDIATPSEAKGMRNPQTLNAENMSEVREHWVGHCATCHALDGSGATDIGRNLYPPAPDLRDAATQRLTDGELFYIINNGVRFTGMPAWESEHTPEETWLLVAFIRRLPAISPQELEQLKKEAGEAGAAHEHGEEHEHKHPPAHKH
jgi:mono/diheme cytochrome c family protein